MTQVSGRSNGAGVHITFTPDPSDIAKEIGRYINKPMGDIIGDLHRQLSDVPISEIKSRASGMGGGHVRVGRAVEASASKSALTVKGGKGFPDFAGQEWGALQYGQFDPWMGNDDTDGYVIGGMLSDDGFMEDFLDQYVEGLVDELRRVWDE